MWYNPDMAIFLFIIIFFLVFAVSMFLGQYILLELLIKGEAVPIFRTVKEMATFQKIIEGISLNEMYEKRRRDRLADERSNGDSAR